MYFVYIYSDISGTPFYVGKGKKKRDLYHLLHALDLSSVQDTPCIRKCRKLIREGDAIFIDRVFFTADEVIAKIEEKRLIALYKRKCDGGTLVNLTLGGDGGSGIKQSAAHIEKRCAQLRGKIRTEEQRKCMSENFVQSEKRSLAAKKRANTKEAKERVSRQFAGKPLSPDRRARISEWNKLHGVKPPTTSGNDHPRAKTQRILLPSGEIISTPCLKQFCEMNGLNMSAVRNTLYQKRPLARGAFAGLMLLGT